MRSLVVLVLLAAAACGDDAATADAGSGGGGLAPSSVFASVAAAATEGVGASSPAGTGSGGGGASSGAGGEDPPCTDCTPQGAMTFALPSPAGATVWTTTTMDKVVREAAQPTEEGAGLAVFAAKNEVEPVQIVVRADADATVTLALSDPTGPGGALAGARIDRVGYVRIDTPSDAGSIPSGWIPDPLEPTTFGADEPLASGENQPFWITFTIPGDAAAGDYAATLSVTVDGDTAEVPLSLHVFDFALPDAIGFDGNWNASMNDLGGGESLEKVQELKDFFFAHRMVPSSVAWPAGLNYTGGIEYDCDAGAFVNGDGAYDFAQLGPKYIDGEGWNGVGFPSFQVMQFVDTSSRAWRSTCRTGTSPSRPGSRTSTRCSISCASNRSTDRGGGVEARSTERALLRAREAVCVGVPTGRAALAASAAVCVDVPTGRARWRRARAVVVGAATRKVGRALERMGPGAKDTLRAGARRHRAPLLLVWGTSRGARATLLFVSSMSPRPPGHPVLGPLVAILSTGIVACGGQPRGGAGEGGGGGTAGAGGQAEGPAGPGPTSTLSSAATGPAAPCGTELGGLPCADGIACDPQLETDACYEAGPFHCHEYGPNCVPLARRAAGRAAGSASPTAHWHAAAAGRRVRRTASKSSPRPSTTPGSAPPARHSPAAPWIANSFSRCACRPSSKVPTAHACPPKRWAAPDTGSPTAFASTSPMSRSVSSTTAPASLGSSADRSDRGGAARSSPPQGASSPASGATLAACAATSASSGTSSRPRPLTRSPPPRCSTCAR